MDSGLTLGSGEVECPTLLPVDYLGCPKHRGLLFPRLFQAPPRLPTGLPNLL